MTRPGTRQRRERDPDRDGADQPAQAKRSPECMPSQRRHPDESNSPEESNDGCGGAASRSTGSGGGGPGAGAAGAGAAGAVVGSGADATGAGVDAGVGAAVTTFVAGDALLGGDCDRWRGRGSGRRSGSAATGRSSTDPTPVRCWFAEAPRGPVPDAAAGRGSAPVESRAITNATRNAAMAITTAAVEAVRLGPPWTSTSRRVNHSDMALGVGHPDRRIYPIASAGHRGGSRSWSTFRSGHPA